MAQDTSSPAGRLKYLCAQCGAMGLPDQYTSIDARYTTGMCTGDHVGRQYLVREDASYTEKKKARRTASR